MLLNLTTLLSGELLIMRDKREGAGFNCESPETMMPCEAREETGSRLAGNITKGQ